MDRYSTSRTVTEADTAAAHDSSLPPAASTPYVLAIAESACIGAMSDRLDSTQVSVGARAEIDHLAPSRVGAQLTATAELIEQSGPRYVFDVDVTEDGRTVARVRHTRAIVTRAAILERLAPR